MAHKLRRTVRHLAGEPPPRLSPARRALKLKQLAAARAAHSAARKKHVAAQKASAVRKSRQLGRARHNAWLRVRNLERSLGLPSSLLRHRRRRPRRITAQVLAKHRALDLQDAILRCNRLYASVCYDGHDADVDEAVACAVELFGGVVHGTGYSFYAQRRDIDFHFTFDAADVVDAKHVAHTAARTLTALGAVLSAVPNWARLQLTWSTMWSAEAGA